MMKALSLVPVPSWQALTVPFNPVSLSLWKEANKLNTPVDIVHATAFPYSFPLVVASRLARRLKAPFVLTPFVHTGDPEDPQDRIRRAYTTPALMHIARQADLLFVQTGGEREELLKRGVLSERIVLQGLGVDQGSCTGGNRERIRQQWSIKSDEVVIGHLSNNSVEKGTVDLLQAVEHIWSNGGNCRLVLAGAQMPNFRSYWDRFAMKERVQLLGVLDAEQKRDFFAGIDVFAMPSRSDSFGLVFPEAWANGIPCVGYRAGGVAWVIRDGIDGRLVPCGDIPKLAETLRQFCESADQRKEMGRAGFERIERGEFDWNRSLNLVREKCAELCHTNRNTKPEQGR